MQQVSQQQVRIERNVDYMISFAVFDDEKESREKIKKTIDKLFMRSTIEYEVEEFSCYDKSFEAFMNQSALKIYILDVEIANGISGIDVARKIRKNDWNSIIIMLTSHTDLGYDVLKAKIMLLAFISKYDECEKQLMSAIKTAIRIIGNKKSITFETSGIFHRVYLDDILYISKDTVDRKCVITTTYEEYAVSKTLNQMLEEIDERFYLSHRSCLVNTDRIKTIDWKQNVIYFEQNKATNLISRDKKKGLKEVVSLG